MNIYVQWTNEEYFIGKTINMKENNKSNLKDNEKLTSLNKKKKKSI